MTLDVLPFSVLTPGQLDAAVAIYREAFDAPWEWPADKIAGLARPGDGAAAAYALGLVDGGEAIGLAVASYLPGANLGYLRYLAVAPERRGAGAGSILLDAARAAGEGWARTAGAAGCRGLLAEIEVVDGPPPAADRTLRRRRVAFYLRHGAIPTGVQVPRPPWAPPEMPRWEVMILPGAAWDGALDGRARRQLCLALMVEGYGTPATAPWLQTWLARAETTGG